jgi:predicted N-acetyltransferase YhbS
LYRFRVSGEDVVFRRAVDADAEAVRHTIEAAIRSSASDYYDSSTLDAWASGGSVDGVRRMIAGTIAFVAVANERVVGFANLDGHEVDQLYVHPDAGSAGVARGLYVEIETAARRAGLSNLTAVASLRAEPAFIRFGFRSQGRTQHEFNGTAFEVVLMGKELGRSPAN